MFCEEKNLFTLTAKVLFHILSCQSVTMRDASPFFFVLFKSKWTVNHSVMDILCAYVWNHALASTRQMQLPEIIQGQEGPPFMPQQRHISCKARSKFILIHILGGKQNVSSPSLLPMVPLQNRSELLYVEGKPKDKVDEGPVTPEAQPQPVTSIHYITAAYK